MPLLDHFNPPLNRTHPWRSFHGAWAAAMARLLNQGVLPSGFYAVPLVDRDGPIEIDVAALREQGAPLPASGAAWPQAWMAPAPALAVAVDLPAVDGVENNFSCGRRRSPWPSPCRPSPYGSPPT
jgi:hypothetical protein